jgi:hypothetical protein
MAPGRGQRVTELHVGDQQVDVRVRRSCGIDVVCRVDGRPIRWTDLHGPMIASRRSERP